MALNFEILGNGRKVAVDRVTKTIGGNSHDVDRQHVITVQPEDAAQLGFPAAQLAHLALASIAPSENMNVDGSVTPVDFSYTVPVGKGLLLDAVDIVIRDDGATFTAITFGGVPALANGLQLRILDASDVLVANLIIDQAKDLGDLLRVAQDYFTPVAGFSRLSIACSRGGAALYVPEGYEVRATVRDNLTGLDELRCTLRGRVMP